MAARRHDPYNRADAPCRRCPLRPAPRVATDRVHGPRRRSRRRRSSSRRRRHGGAAGRQPRCRGTSGAGSGRHGIGLQLDARPRGAWRCARRLDLVAAPPPATAVARGPHASAIAGATARRLAMADRCQAPTGRTAAAGRRAERRLVGAARGGAAVGTLPLRRQRGAARAHGQRREPARHRCLRRLRAARPAARLQRRRCGRLVRRLHRHLARYRCRGRKHRHARGPAASRRRGEPVGRRRRARS